MLEKQYDLVKHTATIHIPNSLSLVERKVSNVLLRNAYSSLLTKQVHEISISELSESIGWEEGNADEKIKSALKQLVNLHVSLNVIGKDNKNSWGVTTLLAQAVIENGKCSYAYSPLMQKLLYNPNIYARLNLSIQTQFKSKHSLALWEFLVEILCSAKVREGVSKVTLEKFKELLAVTEGYEDFKKLNQKVIKPAIEEINLKSDILAEVTHIREGRKVAALLFSVKYKDQAQPFLPLADDIGEPVVQEGDDPRKEKLQERLKGVFKVPSRTAKRLLDTYSCEEIENDLLAVTESMKDGKIKNIAAFTIKAIEDHYGEKIGLQKTGEAAEVKFDQEREDSITHEGWKRVRAGLRAAYGDGVFNSWFAQLDLIGIDENEVWLSVQTLFKKNWIENNYMNNLQKLWQQEDSTIKRVSLKVTGE